MAYTFRNTASTIRRYVEQHTLYSYVITFFVMFFGIKLSQYIYIELQTSPAVIFPSIGVALGAVLLGGYRMVIPIFLAHIFSLLTTSPMPAFIFAMASVAAYTLQPVAGAYLLRLVGFNPGLRTTRDAVMFIAAALILPAIAPTFTLVLNVLFLSTQDAVWSNWSRAWAGGVMSVMVVTPLILSWLTEGPAQVMRKPVREKILAIITLLFPIYLLFWIEAPPLNTFILLYLLFGILFWIGLRMGPRIMTLALFFVAALSIGGTLFFPPEQSLINQQLLSIELFIILIAPIFIILASLVEERRVIAVALMENIKKLENALYEISTADTAKSEFIAILAHELRNPLAPIVSSLEWLKIQEQTKESLETIEVAQTHTHTMKRLLDDLLDVARVTQKKFRLQRKTTELKELMTMPLHTVENLMHTKRHNLIVKMPQTPVHLFVDSVRFQQIIVNLLTNAAKYTPQNGRIELRCMESDDQTLLIEIKDNGIGIKPEDLERIFNPFGQVVKNKKGDGGLGIGLYLTKILVEMHNGTISVTSDGEHKGSTFSLKLPTTKVETAASTLTPASSAAPAQISAAQDSKYKVLLVDDNLTLAQGLKKLLQHKGYEVSTAHSGSDAIRAVESFKPRVVLLDIGLPDMDGYEVTKILREKKLPVIIIALTGYGQDKDRDLAREAGFDYHLVKPVGIADIEVILNEATQTHLAQADL